MKTKLYLTAIFLFIVTFCKAQTYCNGVNNPPTLFNPSFEMNTCCPDNFSTFSSNFLDCVPGWEQASPATTDYYNDDCNNWFLNQIPLNASDGSGFVGILVKPGYHEYVGATLIDPFIAGGEYSLSFDVAYNNVWQDCGFDGCDTQWLNNSWGNIPITLFGSPNGNDLPFPSNGGCPQGFGFTNLGEVIYSPGANWNTVTITFAPNQNINAIALGGPCGVVPGYANIGDNDGPYLYIDNLVLSVESPPALSLNQSGDPCSNDLIVNVENPSVVPGNYTWYVNGNQINGISGSTADLSDLDMAVGDVIGVAFNASTGFCVEGELTVINLNTPTASFSTSTTCEGQNMQVTDLSSVPQGSIVDWEWEFANDNGTATGPNPEHLFNQPGTYAVTLTVTSEAGCSNSVSEDVVIHPNPTISFEPLLVCVNIENEFEDLSVANGQTISEVDWDFGDGSPVVSGLSVDHTYSAGGTYTVSQTVTTNMGCSNSASADVFVEEIPAVAFDWNDPCANQELAVFTNETDSGDVAIDFYQWQFGDGESNIGTNAEHLYAEQQLAEAWLFAHTENGCVDSTMNVVTVKGVTAQIDLVNVCEDADAEMQNLSEAHNDDLGTSVWDFGQGLTSNSFEPTTSYSNYGMYDIQLIQFSASGCIDSTSMNIEIYQNPAASFIHVHDSCIYENIGFAGNSFVPETDELIEYNWQFGDGNNSSSGPDATHAYTQSGTMLVNYSVLSALGCVHDTTISIDVKPLPIPDFEVSPVCEYAGPSEFIYLPVASNAEIIHHYWEFGDGNSSEEIFPTNQYNQFGTYDATLTITDQFNCVNSITQDAIVERVVTEFDAPLRSGCPPLEVEFNNSSWTSHSPIESYQWTTEPFSIPQVAMNPEMEFENPSGTANQFYDVQLVVNSEYGCVDTAFASQYIEVYYAPDAAFVLEYDKGQEVLQYIRTHNMTTSATSFLWELGNGSMSENENVDWFYLEHGEYEVSLTAFSPNGCPRTVSEVIYIKPANQLYIPNAFTPNADGTNEKFGPVIYGDDIKRYEFKIFNRYGNKVFHTENPETWWDGASKNGGDYYSQNEVFVYQIVIQFENDPVAQQHEGHVTIIR